MGWLGKFGWLVAIALAVFAAGQVHALEHDHEDHGQPAHVCACNLADDDDDLLAPPQVPLPVQHTFQASAGSVPGDKWSPRNIAFFWPPALGPPRNSLSAR